jgi:hypothetical protein
MAVHGLRRPNGNFKPLLASDGGLISLNATRFRSEAVNRLKIYNYHNYNGYFGGLG